MEKLLEVNNVGVGIIIFLAAHLFLRIGEGYLKFRSDRERVSETTVQELIKAFSQIKPLVDEIPKFKTDVRRFYTAIKLLAGDRWSKIRDEIIEEEKLKNGSHPK